jgi:hypothetical protein
VARRWPKSTVNGVQTRLTMLGYDLGRISGTIGAGTDFALLSFQANEGSEPNGANDGPTQNAIANRFGE